MEDDSAMAYVEEEIPLVPPQVPPDSLMFSSSNLQDHPHNFGQLPPQVDLASNMVGCLVEEEAPPARHDETIMTTT